MSDIDKLPDNWGLWSVPERADQLYDSAKAEAEAENPDDDARSILVRTASKLSWRLALAEQRIADLERAAKLAEAISPRMARRRNSIP